MAANLGLQLSDKMALATAQYFGDSKGGGRPHWGVLKLTTHVGYRPQQSASAGLGIGLHGGYDKKYSFLQIDLLTMNTKNLDSGEDNLILVGGSMLLKLTLIF